jgi:hypothetical protein
MAAQQAVVGRAVEIWLYPVKSMMGEALNAADVGQHGLLGDRAFALVDEETCKGASAKNPRRWPGLFDFRAGFVEPPTEDRPLPPVRITLPDGDSLTTDQPDAEARLSAATGRRVRLARTAPASATVGTFFDCA